MSLWDWVVAAYGRPGVPETCLKLQDESGLNTSLLLWAAWARPSDPAVLARAADVTTRWDDTALKPLRSVRRALKSPLPPVDDGAREALREDVKAAELQAERVLVETLEALCDAAPLETDALQAMTAAAQACGKSAPSETMAALAAGLA